MGVFIKFIMIMIFLWACTQQEVEPIRKKRAALDKLGELQTFKYKLDFLSTQDKKKLEDTSVRQEYGLWLNKVGKQPDFIKDYVEIKKNKYLAITVSKYFNSLFTGVFIRPKDMDPQAPVLVVLPGHTGLSDARTRSLLPLVATGYQVFALDIYNEIPQDKEQGKELDSQISDVQIKTYLLAIIDFFVDNSLPSGHFIFMGWDIGGERLLRVSKEITGRVRGVITYFSEPYVIKEDLIPNTEDFIYPRLLSFSSRQGPNNNILKILEFKEEIEKVGWQNRYRITVFNEGQNDFMLAGTEQFHKQLMKEAFQQTIDYINVILEE